VLRCAWPIGSKDEGDTYPFAHVINTFSLPTHMDATVNTSFLVKELDIEAPSSQNLNATSS